MAGWGGKRKGAGRPPGSKRSQKSQSNLTGQGRNGEFMQGNVFRHPGRPNKYSVAEMRDRVAEYLEDCRACEKPATWPELTLRLGLSRQALWAYRRGECGRDEETRRDYAELLELVDLYMEAALEAGLQRIKGQTAGIQFALTNRFSADWRQRVEHTSTQALEVHIDLHRANELSPPIEPQVIRGEE